MSATITYAISSAAELNADILAIDLGGSASAANTNYVFLLTTDVALNAGIAAINLIAGDTLSIQGDNVANQQDGGTLVSAINGGGATAGLTVTGGAVSFSAINFTGQTGPGGAVAVAAGGSLSISNSTVGGAGIVVQGGSSVVLTNDSVTGAIAGAGSVIADGAVTLSAAGTYSGGTTINGNLTLAAPGAAGTGEISFGSATGNTLTIGLGDAPANAIGGFVPNPAGGSLPSNVIDVLGIGLATGYSLSAGNQLTLTGASAPVTLQLDQAISYAADSFVLQADASGGTQVTVVQSLYLVGSEADLNAALAQIDVGGKAAASNQSYSIVLTAGFTLGSDISAVNLMAGDTLSIDGAGNTIDGGGIYRGFFDYAGGLSLSNMTIQNAVASGGAGGGGSIPGGGGAGLGGALFVGSAGAATLSNVTFLNDSATGGAAGAAGGIAVGGGGGLGGAGGTGQSGHFPSDGGGGGIGVGAFGGSGNIAAGGAGIIAGGGGGTSGGTIVTVTHGGSGRGGGGGTHYWYTAVAAKSGGLPGFGGGAANGGAAGFGGGGANSVGGFGGGGSGAYAGGWGAGNGVTSGAGGGAGLGGGVFVQQGGSLTIVSGSESGGSVAGGAGSNGGGAGSAIGSALFLQGTGSVTLAPGAGQTVSIADSIGDQGGNGGAGSVVVNGAGTVVLSGASTYTGGTTILNGTLSLQSASAAGTGIVTFGYGAPTTLIVGAGDVPANALSDFLPNDVIDLQGIGTATSATVDANNMLTIAGGTSTVYLQIDPLQILTGETFNVASDGAGGTLITASDINGDTPPSIAGVSTRTGDDHTALNPFAGVSLLDVDAGQTETVTITESSTVNGVFSNLGTGGFNAATGVYTVTGSTAQITAALQGLVFTPTEYQVAPGQTVSTQFTITASDGQMNAVTRNETVNITALNDAPVIANASPGFVEGEWNAPFAALAGLSVVDPDSGATETVTLTSSGALSLSMPGMTLTQTAAGTYVLSAGTPDQVNAALQSIQLTTVPNPAAPGFTVSYIGVSVSDGIAAPTTASVEVLSGLPIFQNVSYAQTATAGQPTTPFAAASVIDAAGLSIQGFTIILYDPSSNYLNPTDANGILSGANLTKVGVGTYTLTAGSTAAVSAELQGLTFTPTTTNATMTTDIVLSAFDGATTANSNAIAITALPGPPVADVAGSVAGQTVADNATIAPFASVVVTDGSAIPIDSATITLTDGSTGLATDANGTLSGAGLVQTGVGTYTLTATDPAGLSAELNALVFVPTLNEVAPGSAAVTAFALAVTNENGTFVDNTTSVLAIPTAVDPVISGTAAGQLVADDGSSISPFSAVMVTDGNAAPLDSATITISDTSAWYVPTDADGMLSGAGLTYVGTGTYVLTATDPASLSAELQALAFTPTAGLVAAGQSATAQFTLRVADNLATATDYNTMVSIVASSPPTLSLDPVAGGNSVNAATALAGFAITGTTTNVEDGQTVWVLVYSATAGGYVDTLSATVSGGTFSAAVTPAEALFLGDGTLTAYAYATNLAGITTQTASEDFSVNLAGAVAATPTIGTTTLSFGAMRVGATPVTLTTTVANGAAANPDQSALSYTLGTLPAGFAGDATASGTLASGTGATVDVTLNTAISGLYANAPVSVAFTSLAPAGSGLTDTALASGTLSLSAKVYATAVAQVAAQVNFGVVHVGDTVSQALTVTNAASGALTDVLTGGFGTVSTGFTGSGTLGTGLAAGASGSLTLGLRTTASGVFTGSAALNFASHDADLANIAVAAGPVTLTGTVDNYAVAAWEKVAGSGTLTHSGNAWTLSLGTVLQGSAPLSVTLGALNAATGLADVLSGGFTAAGSSAFGNSGLGAFAGLGAGQADTAPVVTFSTSAAGTFTETITLNATGSNASGYVGALAAQTLTITGTVTQTVFNLTTGVDTVAGTSASNTVVATSNALSSGDNIAAGSGTNTLVLSGGGTFDLSQPATLTGIRTITAQEGQGATAQVVTLRAGLNATVNVASDTAGDASPTITIIGAANSDTINLGKGNDTVTLGAGETVNGGGGNNTFTVNATTIASTINGGSGVNTLVVTGGGSVTMGSRIAGISKVNLAATTAFTANATSGLAIAGSSAGGDTIVLGAGSQSVVSGGANELVRASAANAGAAVSGLGPNSTLEVTSGGTVTLNAATNVTTVKLDAASLLTLNGMQFITASGSTGSDTITAGAINQTLTGGAGTDTLIGYSGGSDIFRDTASGLNGDTIKGFLSSDTIDLTNLAFAGATLSVAASGGNTVVTATSGATKSVFTMAGSWSGSGFHLATDGSGGTIITHG